MVTVKFNSVADFIEEIRIDHALVARGIVRCTRSYRSTPLDQIAPMRELSVVASCVIAGQIIKLISPCGMVADTGHTDNPAHSRAGDLIKQLYIQLVAIDSKLQLRAGVIEDTS